MKVTWTAQVKTDDPKKALEMSQGKWWFFANCTEAQLRKYGRWIGEACGLCKCTAWATCEHCPFSELFFKEWYGCPDIYSDAKLVHEQYIEGEATLKDFHSAARKVWDKLKSLR